MQLSAFCASLSRPSGLSSTPNKTTERLSLFSSLLFTLMSHQEPRLVWQGLPVDDPWISDSSLLVFIFIPVKVYKGKISLLFRVPWAAVRARLSETLQRCSTTTATASRGGEKIHICAMTIQGVADGNLAVKYWWAGQLEIQCWRASTPCQCFGGCLR